jgi:hypothetical protein
LDGSGTAIAFAPPALTHCIRSGESVFNRVAVWLDEYAPDRGAFAHASDWAARLHLAIQVVASPDEAGEFFRDADLSAFCAALPARPRDWLLRESLANPKAAVMVCPAAWSPPARTLILHQGSGTDFLDRVVPLCSCLAIRPVVLSVDRTERKAEERQELARAVCCRGGLSADFDLIAGCDVRTAVDRAARARGCSHVILERENDSPWRRWLRGDSFGRLLGLADRLTLVTLPGATRSPRAN